MRTGQKRYWNKLYKEYLQFGAVLIVTLFLALFSPFSMQAKADVSGQEIVNFAKSYVGKVPYVWGGNSFSTGMDCSGFVCGVYKHFGIDLWSYRTKIRNSPLVTNIGTDLNQAKPGDILWFEGHVAIYTGKVSGVHYMVNETKGTYNGITDNVIYSPVTVHKNALQNIRGILQVKGVNGSSGSGSYSGDWSVTVTPYSDDVYVKGTYNSGYKAKYTGAGVIIRKNFNGQVVVNHNESCNHTMSNPSVWYDTVYKEIGVKLEPGVTYSFQLWVIFDGEKQYSPLKTFTTTGSCSHNWVDQGVQEQPTALYTGTMIQGCTKCGATTSRDLAKLTPSLTLNASSLTLKPGEIFNIKATGLATADYVSYYSTDNSSVARIDGSGKITAQNQSGTAVITVNLASGKYGVIRVSVIVEKTETRQDPTETGQTPAPSVTPSTPTVTPSTPTVTPGKVVSIKVSGKKKVAVGKKRTFKAAVSVSGQADKTVIWTSGKPSVASVSGSGVVKGKKPGKAVIYAKAADGSGVVGKRTIYVLPKKISTFNTDTASGRYIFAYWGKQKGISGYQLQYSKSSKFKSKKTKSLSKGKTSYAFRVSKKATYYVRIRAFIKISGKRYYGAWSKVRKVKAK